MAGIWRIQRAYSEKVAGEIDSEVKAIMDDCYARAKAIIMSTRGCAA